MGLVTECQAGDQTAWNRLCRQYAGRVHRWAVLLGLRPADAEDAAQEVLVIAVRRIDTCRDDAALPSWLFQITRRTVANVRRSAWWRRVLLSEGPVEPAFSHAEPLGREREIAIRSCLARLSRKHVEVLVLSEIEGFTRQEVAEILRIAPGTVASRIRLARVAFKKIWNEREGDGTTPALARRQAS